MELAPSPPPEPKPCAPARSRWPLIAFAVIGLFMLGVVVIYAANRWLTVPSNAASTAVVIVLTPTFSTAAPPTQEPITSKQRAAMDGVIARTRHFRGNVNAPVTLIEFGDFQ